jgi:methyl-accepting chemotaxis protein
MAKTVIGKLSAILSLSNKGFNAGLANSSKRLRRFGSALKVAGAVVGAVGGLIAGGALALGMFVRAQVKALDTQVKFAKRLGIVVGRLQGLHVAANLAGVNINQLNIGMQRMGRRVAEAAKGMGEAQGALKELGLDAQKLSKLSIDRQFLAIADAMKKVQGRGEQVRLTFKLFDSEGVAVVNLLDKGSKRLEEIMAFSEKVGATISEDTAKAVERTADALTMAQVAWQGLKNVVTVAFMPVVEKLTLDFAKWMSNTDQVKASIKVIAADVLDIFNRAGNVFEKIEKVVNWLDETAKNVAWIGKGSLWGSHRDDMAALELHSAKMIQTRQAVKEGGIQAVQPGQFLSPLVTGETALADMANSLGGAQVSH